MLINICNLWNECLITSIITYAIALLFLVFTILATRTRHVIIGAIMALTAGFFGQISRIVFLVSIILAIARLILIFI